MPDAIKPLQKQLNIENVMAIPTFAPCCSVPNEPIEKPSTNIFEKKKNKTIGKPIIEIPNNQMKTT